MNFETLKWVGGIDGYLELIDQRKLPAEFVKLQCHDIKAVWEAIKTLAIRGAPAIGVAAGYGVVVGLNSAAAAELSDALNCVQKSCDYLATSRPTAVNLFRTLERVRQLAAEYAATKGAGTEGLREAVLAEANAIRAEDVEMCRRIGLNGARFIRDKSRILTHCNAGALATAGQGTALSLMFEAKKQDKEFTVYVDETRPLLQGSRLTAWELKRAGIDTVLICDNMAGALMQQRKLDTVITGADRIAANGDTANKIGTYTLSVLAKEHGIPFCVAAPSSTFDLTLANGSQIPIEKRDAEEVKEFAGRAAAPPDVAAYNPAFDVTPARNISAIITDRGVIDSPNVESIARLFS